MLSSVERLGEAEKLKAALYIHIPFCSSKCSYCNFYSLGRHFDVPQEYVNAVVREIKRYNIKPETVYFGGGTPGLLTPAQVKMILTAADAKSGAEITIEVNPDTADEYKLKGYFDAGVNRISIGVQTADDKSLSLLGRGHSSKQAEQTFKDARQAGFTNISGDIMLSLPSYSQNEFDRTLELISEGGAVHISSYILKIEENTVFGKRPPIGLPDDDMSADFYLYSVSEMEKQGYKQYEISNFAKDDKYSRHNMVYWDMKDYLGIGPSAYSCINGERSHYDADIKGFIDGNRMQSDGKSEAIEFIMLQTRLAKGLNVRELENRYNITFTQAQLNKINRFCNADMCSFDEDILKLTPSGLLIQNSILSEIT